MRTAVITTIILFFLVTAAIPAEQAEVCIDRPENQGVLNIRSAQITANGKNLISIVGGETKCVVVPPGLYEVVAQSPDPYKPENESLIWKSAPLTIVVQSNATIKIDLTAITQGATYIGPWKLTETTTSRQTENNIMRINKLIHAPIKQIGENNKSVQAILGTPSSRITEQLTNRHDPKQKDQIHTLSYKNLIVRIYSAPSINKEMLLSVRLTEDRPGVLPELIGRTMKSITEQFGEPMTRDGSIFNYMPVYNIDEPGQDVVKIEFNNSLVSAVEWDYYVD